jgi:hypothetical protein
MSRGHLIEMRQKGAILVEFHANLGQFHTIRG